MYYFLKKDFDALNAEIEKLADKIKEIGHEMEKAAKRAQRPSTTISPTRTASVSSICGQQGSAN